MTRCDLCGAETQLIVSEFAFRDATGWDWIRHFSQCPVCEREQVDFECIENTALMLQKDTPQHYRMVARSKIRPFRAKNED